MNGSTEHQMSDASDQKGRHAEVLTWEQAQSMLPLVRHIAEDILAAQGRLSQHRRDKRELDHCRYTLDWPLRSRRYALGEEIKLERQRLREAKKELEALGLALIDKEVAQVGFPTIVNNRRAYFSWRMGEASIQFWHFAKNPHRREIPPSWTSEPTKAAQ